MRTETEAEVESKRSRLKRIQMLSHWLDNAVAIPGTSYRVGLDPVLGLLPGGGDLVSSGFSAYLVLEAARFGLPRTTLTRMVFNLVLDAVFGSVPFVGDFFDVAWKANSKNLALLESHLQAPRSSQVADRWFVVLLLGGFALVSLGLAAFTIVVMTWLIRAISGA